MKIKTEVLQVMVSKSIQGSSNNKMIPITSLMGIAVKDKKLTLITTDGSNQLRIMQNIELDPVEGPTDQFYTIVNAETFSKLVGKTTTEFIELENKESYLLVTGNGDYKLEISINEEGEMVKFPDISLSSDEKNTKVINVSILNGLLDVAKASSAKTMEIPYLTGCYFSNNEVISTNRQIACKIEEQTTEEPMLLSSEMIELLKLVDSETIVLTREDNNLYFFNDNIVISGKELESKELYPVQAIDNLTKLEYANNIVVNRQELLAVLDRMSLFVNGNYDKNGVHLAFTTEALLVKSQKSNAQELIDGKCTSDQEFNVLVDIDMLKTQLESLQEENVTIYFGQSKSIELKEGNITLVLSIIFIR